MIVKIDHHNMIFLKIELFNFYHLNLFQVNVIYKK